MAIRNGVDCPVAYRLSMQSAEPVPSFIRYNSVTHELEVKPLSLANIGEYVVVLTANMETESEEVNYQFEVFCTTAFALA